MGDNYEIWITKNGETGTKYYPREDTYTSVKKTVRSILKKDPSYFAIIYHEERWGGSRTRWKHSYLVFRINPKTNRLVLKETSKIFPKNISELLPSSDELKIIKHKLNL